MGVSISPYHKDHSIVGSVSGPRLWKPPYGPEYRTPPRPSCASEARGVQLAQVLPGSFWVLRLYHGISTDTNLEMNNHITVLWRPAASRGMNCRCRSRTNVLLIQRSRPARLPAPGFLHRVGICQNTETWIEPACGKSQSRQM